MAVFGDDDYYDQVESSVSKEQQEVDDAEDDEEKETVTGGNPSFLSFHRQQTQREQKQELPVLRHAAMASTEDKIHPLPENESLRIENRALFYPLSPRIEYGDQDDSPAEGHKLDHHHKHDEQETEETRISGGGDGDESRAATSSSTAKIRGGPLILPTLQERNHPPRAKPVADKNSYDHYLQHAFGTLGADTSRSDLLSLPLAEEEDNRKKGAASTAPPVSLSLSPYSQLGVGGNTTGDATFDAADSEGNSVGGEGPDGHEQEQDAWVETLFDVLGERIAVPTPRGGRKRETKEILPGEEVPENEASLVLVKNKETSRPVKAYEDEEARHFGSELSLGEASSAARGTASDLAGTNHASSFSLDLNTPLRVFPPPRHAAGVAASGRDIPTGRQRTPMITSNLKKDDEKNDNSQRTTGKRMTNKEGIPVDPKSFDGQKEGYQIDLEPASVFAPRSGGRVAPAAASPSQHDEFLGHHKQQGNQQEQQEMNYRYYHQGPPSLAGARAKKPAPAAKPTIIYQQQEQSSSGLSTGLPSWVLEHNRLQNERRRQQDEMEGIVLSRLHQLIDRVPEPCLLTLISFPFRVVHANQAYGAAVNQSSAAAIGVPFFELVEELETSTSAARAAPSMSNCPTLVGRFGGQEVVRLLCARSSGTTGEEESNRTRSISTLTQQQRFDAPKDGSSPGQPKEKTGGDEEERPSVLCRIKVEAVMREATAAPSSYSGSSIPSLGPSLRYFVVRLTPIHSAALSQTPLSPSDLFSHLQSQYFDSVKGGRKARQPRGNIGGAAGAGGKRQGSKN